MRGTASELDLFYTTDGKQKLPPDMTLLFRAASNGDTEATDALLDAFASSIIMIAQKIQDQYNAPGQRIAEKLFAAGAKTLKDFTPKHDEDGFCSFILFAIRENMRYALATQCS